jgi:hypothetical protein
MQKVHMKLSFDPNESQLKDIFEHDFGRTVWLLWRRNHIVSDRFNDAIRELMRRWDNLKPESPERLAHFWPINSVDFSREDVQQFCDACWGNLVETESVTYAVTVPHV